MPGFAGVNLDQKIADSGLDGLSHADHTAGGSSGSSGDAGGGAPSVKDTGTSDQSELDLLADDGGAEPKGTAERNAQAQAINDYLDFEANKTKKVKIGDQEFTLADLHKGNMRQQDYSRKTQELAQDRKYTDNLDADLAKLAENPELLVEFKRIYPAKYHGLGDRASSFAERRAAETNPEAGKQGDQNKADPELVRRLKTLEDAETARAAEAKEREIKSFEQEIESTMKELGPKYPLADDDLALSKAQQLLSHLRAKAEERGENPSSVKLSKQHWERVYKLTHEQSEKRYQAHYGKQRQKQSSAHAQGRDVASGGGLPGNAPKTMKLRDVADHAIAALTAKGSGAP